MVLRPGTARGPFAGSRRAGRRTGYAPAPSTLEGAGVRPRWWRPVSTVLALFVGLGVVLATPGPAYAHAQLIGSTPANGARLDRAPTEVTLQFSERVNVVRDGVRLLDASGAVRSTQPARVDPTAPAQVRLPVPTGLGDGLYTVSWRVVSADSHPISGAFVFGVGDVAVNPLPDSGARSEPFSPLSALFWLARWVGYAALALLVGGAMFLLLCWPAGWAQPRVRRLLVTGWTASLSCSVAVLLLQGPYASGGGLGQLANPDALTGTLGTDFGEYVLARIGLHLIAGVLLLRLAGRPAAPATSWRAVLAGWRTVLPPLALLVIALPATWVGTGHANAEASLLAAVADTAHIAAMAVWIGGLAMLSICLLPRSADRPLPEVAAALPRFSQLATVSVAVIAGTGVYQAWRGIGSLSAVAGSRYGALLVFKLAAVGVLLWFGAISRSVVRRRYLLPAVHAPGAPLDPPPEPVPTGRAMSRPGGRRGQPAGGATAVADRTVPGGRAATNRTSRRTDRAERERDLLARSRLRWSVRIEVAIATAILGLTSVLVATPPASRPDSAAPATVAAGPFTATLDLDAGATVQIRVDPPRAGATQLMLGIRDRAGAAWDVPEVTAAFELTAQGLGPLKVNLRRTNPGAYESDGLDLPASGRWQLLIRVRTSDFEAVPVETEVPIT